MDVFEWLHWLQSHTEIEWRIEGPLKFIRTADDCCPVTVLVQRPSDDVGVVARLWGWPFFGVSNIAIAADGMEACTVTHMDGIGRFYPYIRATLLEVCRLPPEK